VPTELTLRQPLPADEETWTPRRLRAPREDGEVLAEPSLDAAIDAVQRTADQLHGCDVSIQGRALAHLREWTRSQCLTVAEEYTQTVLGGTARAPRDQSGPVFAGGHQPSLFHPGVWIKNFAIAHLAARTGGTAVNLIVDNDTLSTCRVRVPAGTSAAPTVSTIAFDRDRTEQPWEEAVVLDRGLFESFADRVAEAMGEWDIVPIAPAIWPAAIQALDRSPRIADCLTAARHAQEERWGCRNLELPLSRLCTQAPFLWFASHILAHLPRFHALHNSVLGSYRRINKVRSRSHPFPELAQRDEWLEAPFWVWNAQDGRRHHLFARQATAKRLEISDGKQTLATLRLAPDMEACCAVEDLQQLTSDGWRIRTRALTTTLFARLCLCDQFVHGIGGAKYDEMTDRIIQRFYGIEPPQIVTMSATRRLPIEPAVDVTADDLAAARVRRRDLRFNADRIVDGLPTRLIERKSELIDAQHAARTAGLTRRERRARRAENRRRYLLLQDVNLQLLHAAQAASADFDADERHLSQALGARQILRDREFSFCIHPEATLRSLMDSLPARWADSADQRSTT